jgi:hypothetical protein
MGRFEIVRMQRRIVPGKGTEDFGTADCRTGVSAGNPDQRGANAERFHGSILVRSRTTR